MIGDRLVEVLLVVEHFYVISELFLKDFDQVVHFELGLLDERVDQLGCEGLIMRGAPAGLVGFSVDFAEKKSGVEICQAYCLFFLVWIEVIDTFPAEEAGGHGTMEEADVVYGAVVGSALDFRDIYLDGFG